MRTVRGRGGRGGRLRSAPALGPHADGRGLSRQRAAARQTRGREGAGAGRAGPGAPPPQHGGGGRGRGQGRAGRRHDAQGAVRVRRPGHGARARPLARLRHAQDGRALQAAQGREEPPQGYRARVCAHAGLRRRLREAARRREGHRQS